MVEPGLNFEYAKELDFATAKFWQGTRQAYSEVRVVAPGYLASRRHVLVFSETERGMRVINFRKVNSREGVKHGFALTRGA